MGLKSKSTGQKEERFITITKVDEDFVTTFDQNKFHQLDLDPDLVKLAHEYLEANPLNEEELAAIEDFATTKPSKKKSKFVISIFVGLWLFMILRLCCSKLSR